MNYDEILGILFLLPLLYEIPFFIYFVKNRHLYPFHDRLPLAVICMILIIFESILYNSSRLLTTDCWNGVILLIFGWPMTFLLCHIYTYRIIHLLFAFEVYDDVQLFTQQIAQGRVPEGTPSLSVKELSSQDPETITKNVNWQMNWYTRHRSLTQPAFVWKISIAMLTCELLIFFLLQYPDYGTCKAHDTTNLLCYLIVAFYIIIMASTGYKIRNRHDRIFLKREFYYVALTSIGILMITVILTLVGLDTTGFQIAVQIYAHLNLVIGLIWPSYLCWSEQKFVAQKLANKSWPLRDVLAMPTGYSSFSAFLQLEFSGENLLFWTEVESYKKSQASEQRDKALFIYDQFLRATAPFPINISDELKKQLLLKFDFSNSSLSSIELTSSSNTPLPSPPSNDNPSQNSRGEKEEENKLSNLFDPIQDEIYNLMASDTYYRFQRTEEFLKIKALLSEQYRADLSTNSSESKGSPGSKKKELKQGSSEKHLDLETASNSENISKIEEP